MSVTWDDSEIQVVTEGLKNELTAAAIAAQLPGRSEGAVKTKIRKLGLKNEVKEIDPTDSRILKLESEVTALKHERLADKKKLKALRHKDALFLAISEEITKVVRPLPPLPSVAPITISDQKLHQTEHVVMHLSDEHMDQKVEPHKVQGLENYTFPIAMRRAEHYVDTVINLTKRTLSNYSFRTLWILAYGDHTSGEIHNACDRSWYRNQFRNCFAISQVHAQMFRELAAYFENVVVAYVPGNHGRRTPKKDYHGAWDNWDYMIAQSAQLQCVEMENIQFIIPDAFAINLNINEHWFAIEHGDEVRSWMGVPFYGLERKGRRIAALNATQGTKIDYFVYGHFHRPSNLGELANQETIINGAWPATDPYALGSLGGFTEPSQWLHGVHPDYGISWRFRVHLRSEGEQSGPQRYKVTLADP